MLEPASAEPVPQGRTEAAKVLPFPIPGARPASETVLLVGNPNVGKSLLFKNLTHRYVNVSNFPGTTVEITKARATFQDREIDVVDSPGVNDLSPRSDDARVTLKLLEQNPGATVVQVADAKNLRRALLLTLQIAELGHPMVLVLNMLDELAARGGRIDREKLSRILGVPVVGTIALKNHGTVELIEMVKEARPASLFLPEAVSEEAYEINRGLLTRVNEILAETYTLSQPRHASLSVRLGFWAMHPFKGLAFLLVILSLVFWFVGLLGAGTLVNLMETGLFKQRITPLAIRATDALLPFPHTHEKKSIAFTFSVPLTPVNNIPLGTMERTVIVPTYTTAPGAHLGPGAQTLRFFHDFLVGQYGVVSMALSYAFAIVLPIVTTFFLLFSLLEDSGYLPRMAIMVNRLFRLMGLNGKAVLPMILGLGCDTMATMTTRILETKKERVVTTMLLALAVPCSAQLGVLLAMMASLSPMAAFAWMGMMIGIVLLVGSLTARAFPGEAGDFILEIPPMRRPQVSNIWRKTLGRLDWYLREVIPLFVVGTGALFLLDKVRALPAIARAGEPLVTGWLGLPKEMSNAFLIGFLRRDFGAVYILDAATGPHPLLSHLQIFVSMVTITLFMPCIANFLMIGKEHGMKTARAMAAFIFPFAFFVGGLVHHLGLWLNIF
ncbi:MAG: FeoB small GTPase domain-containing protein [Thermoanaerobaculia bacterium]